MSDIPKCGSPCKHFRVLPPSTASRNGKRAGERSVIDAGSSAALPAFSYGDCHGYYQGIIYAFGNDICNNIALKTALEHHWKARYAAAMSSVAQAIWLAVTGVHGGNEMARLATRDAAGA